jgi:hypothetical protein
MVGIGKGCFLQLPGAGKRRVLHPAKVLGFSDGVYTAEVENIDLAIEPDQHVVVYFEAGREFMQQSAQVGDVDRADVVDDTEPRLMVAFSTSGEPASAESRQIYRVSTVMADLVAAFAQEEGCPILDLSTCGFSVAATKVHQLGDVIHASVVFDGRTFSGNVCIQSVKELSKGRMRYGLHCADDKAQQGSLASGLPQMSVAVQREQLRRMSGAV